MIIEITTTAPITIGSLYFMAVRTWINGVLDGPYYFSNGASFLSSVTSVSAIICAEYSPSSNAYASYATLEMRNFLMMSGNERIMNTTNGKHY